MIKKLSTMEINIEEIISSVRHCYAEEDNDKGFAELVSTQAVIHAFNAYFDMYFPKFPLNGEKPEVLSCQSEDGGAIIDGQVVIGDIDMGSINDITELHSVMGDAEFWVSNNFEMLMALVEKQNLGILVDESQVDSPGL